ncbi:helix-turn-helix transcriptional regulator [Enterococcus sp. AZ109]|uniref:helix-turn-helix transcriptional regulator n=1 Tax=Enterococcus sp. AZ109 TaxID=2774634 RepID=UPI003F265D8C
MKKNISLEFTDPQEYIQNLDQVNFAYSLVSSEKKAMHFSRIHVIDDLVFTFSDHEPSQGHFFNEETDKRYVGLRFLSSGTEQHHFSSKKLLLTQHECLFFDLSSGKGLYERLTRTQGINILLPYHLIAMRIPDTRHFCLKLNCQNGLGKMVKEYSFLIESQLIHLSIKDRNKVIENYLDLLCFWLIQPENVKVNYSKEILFAQVQDYIHHHLHDSHLNLTKVAEYFGLSQRTIQHLFSDEQMSFSKYVMNQRLTGAAKDLLNSGWTVTDIAYKWGFCDTSYFCRNFKKKFGLTPSHYYHQYQTYQCEASKDKVLCPVKEIIPDER